MDERITALLVVLGSLAALLATFADSVKSAIEVVLDPPAEQVQTCQEIMEERYDQGWAQVVVEGCNDTSKTPNPTVIATAEP